MGASSLSESMQRRIDDLSRQLGAGGTITAQVLKFYPELSCSVWLDYHHSYRKVYRLLAHLRKEVKAGRVVGYRFITVHETCIGRSVPGGFEVKP